MRFLGTIDIEPRKKALDALGTYGNKGVDAINELIGYTVNEEIKVHGFEVIRKTRESMK